MIGQTEHPAYIAALEIVTMEPLLTWSTPRLVRDVENGYWAARYWIREELLLDTRSLLDWPGTQSQWQHEARARFAEHVAALRVLGGAMSINGYVAPPIEVAAVATEIADRLDTLVAMLPHKTWLAQVERLDVAQPGRRAVVYARLFSAACELPASTRAKWIASLGEPTTERARESVSKALADVTGIEPCSLMWAAYYVLYASCRGGNYVPASASEADDLTRKLDAANKRHHEATLELARLLDAAVAP